MAAFPSLISLTPFSAPVLTPVPFVRPLLQRAEDLILGDRPLPSSSTQIEIFAKDLSEEELEKVSDELDMALRPIEESLGELDGDIFEALCNFADQHDLSGPVG